MSYIFAADSMHLLSFKSTCRLEKNEAKTKLVREYRSSQIFVLVLHVKGSKITVDTALMWAISKA